MKLKQITIENFGKLSGISIDLRDGLQPVLEENGWGKSTLSEFIKVMFYGFGNDKKRSILENDRKRYAPWQGGVYGGSLTFETKGRLWRIERTFGEKDGKTDSFSLYDASTNLPSDTYSSAVGEELFGIDRDSFEKTVFIGQQDIATEVTPGISAKIGDLSGELADMAQYEAVQTKLKKEIDSLTPDRKTGMIRKLRDQIAALQVSLMRKDREEEAVEVLQSRIKDTEGKIAEEEARQKQLQDRMTVLGAAKDIQTKQALYRKLAEEEKDLERQLDTEYEYFSAGIPTEEETDEALRIAGLLAAAEKDVTVPPLTPSEMQRFSELQKSLQTSPSPREEPEAEKQGNPGVLIAGVGLLAAGVIVGLSVAVMTGIMLSIAGVIVLAIGLFVLSAGKKKSRENERKEEQYYRQQLRREREEEEFRQLEQKLENRQNFEKILEDRRRQVCDFLRKYSFMPEENLSAQLTALRDRCRELQRLEQALRDKREARQNREADLSAAGWNDIKEIEHQGSLEAVSMQIKESKEKTDELQRNVRGFRQQLSAATEALDAVYENEKELLNLQEQADRLQHRYDILVKTRKYLEMARIGFSTRYMQPLKTAFDEYYRMMADEDGKEYNMNANLDLTVRESGKEREPGLLSTGYQDMIGICRRMSLIDAMYREEKPVLIMDDPFTNLDGKKLEGALRFLRLIGEKIQILYFTCHESRMP